MATLLLPISSQIIIFSQNPNYTTTTTSNRRYLCVPVPLTNNSKTPPPIRNPQRIIPLCSPSPPSASLDKPESCTEEDLEKKQKLPFRGCQACGKEEVEKGCNGEGRVQGGIATVPGFGWWPIKAYRPCPGFVASGGRYRRRGQSMDEVAWGRTEKEITIKITDEVQSSTNKQSPKRSQG